MKVKFYPLNAQVFSREYDLPANVRIGDIVILHDVHWEVVEVTDEWVGVR